MIYLLDYGLIRPTTNTSFTVCFILTLKSSNPIYSVQFINTFCVQHFNFKKFQSCLLSSVYKYFCHFLISNDANLVWWWGPVYFIETPSLDDFQLKLRINSPVNEMETIPFHASNLYFKGSLGYLVLWWILIVLLRHHV